MYEFLKDMIHTLYIYAVNDVIVICINIQESKDMTHTFTYIMSLSNISALCSLTVSIVNQLNYVSVCIQMYKLSSLYNSK